MSNNLRKYLDLIPKAYSPENNRVWYALIYAMAMSDDSTEMNIEEAKKQLFVATAEGKYLEKLANSFGVAKPQGLGMTDVDFRQLIPNLSLKPKVIRKSFYETADIFWGPLYSRANIKANNFAPYNVSVGDELLVSINNGELQKVKALPGDILANGLATAEELKKIFSRIKGATTEILVNSLTNSNYMNIRTNTPGSTGSVEIYASSMIGPTKLDIPVGAYDILSLDQRVTVYNINPNEILIEIPAVIPSLRRTLKGSHHFHATSAIEPQVPPSNGIWQGSFIFNPNGQTNNFTISGQVCQLQQVIAKGNIYTALAVNNNSSFLNGSGNLLLDFGRGTQEGPIRYRGIPSTSTILIDPGYVFKSDHAIGSNINVLHDTKSYSPNKDGRDLAVYLTSPAGARAVVQEILRSLAAAGIIVNFKILAPTYHYLIVNPYL